jgi:DNA-binding IclR family transcriptional regulator
MVAAKKSKSDDEQKEAASYATPALEKGLDILELLAHERDGLTKSEVARGLGRTVSEIFRMLLCLERRGYISQASGDRYVLSLRLFQLVQ